MNFWNDNITLEIEKCEFKKYVIVMSKNKIKNRPPSNEEFKNKMHWKPPNTIEFHLKKFKISFKKINHIEIFKFSYGFFYQSHV
jgi:hypothetical protein